MAHRSWPDGGDPRRPTVAVPRWTAVLGVVLVLGVSGVADGHPRTAGVYPRTGLPFAPVLPARGLVSNEEADRTGAAGSADWVVTSGSLFARRGMGWTGVPDDRQPGSSSVSGTGSAVFRMVTRRRDFGDVTVRVQVYLRRLVTTARTPAREIDGIHLMLRYRDPQSLYVVSVARRDGQVAIKRKTPGGPSNGGTYVALGSTVRWPHRVWTTVSATVRDLPDGSVQVVVGIDGAEVLRVVDSSAGALRGPGGIGVRGDNADFYFRDLVVAPVAG